MRLAGGIPFVVLTAAVAIAHGFGSDNGNNPLQQVERIIRVPSGQRLTDVLLSSDDNHEPNSPANTARQQFEIGTDHDITSNDGSTTLIIEQVQEGRR